MFLRPAENELRLASRAFLLAALFISTGCTAYPQTSYPQRPVQVIIGFPAGGSVDVMARTLVAAVAAQLGQTFAVVNRDGASGTIGFGQVASAPPDGYTLGAGPTTPIAQRLSQRIAYLNGATFAERALADYRYKGELIKAIDLKAE